MGLTSAEEPGPSRRVRALDRARREGADALLVSQRANVRWLSGFTGSNGWLLLRPEEPPCLITDGRYRAQAGAEAPSCRVVIAERGLVRALAPETRGAGVVGFESGDLTWATVAELRDACDSLEWTPIADALGPLRAIKAPDEIAAQRRALALAEEVLTRVVGSLSGSPSEAELAARLEYECRTRGAEAMAFDTIVAGGAHGALPHARPRDVPIVPGTPVVVDMGCVVDGYCSDITRCVYAGDLDEEWRPVVAAVSEAREAAIAAVRPGVPAREVDRAARDALAAHGLGEAFVHSVGHGVGLVVHEPPRLAATSDDVLEAGMVVAVEPGVYLSGRGGVRLEDMVLVTDAGAERLNRLSDRPLRLGGE